MKKRKTQGLLKTGQWWKKKEGALLVSVVIFHVKRVFKNEWKELRADVETWEANGIKIERNLSNCPYDLDKFERVSKAEALAILL